MSTRDNALAALRNWSAPGRRADLVAAAWTAGATNIAELAEAARISRPTVYSDLRSRGIDPDHDRPTKGTRMDTFTPATLDGLTGDDAHDVPVMKEAILRHPPAAGAAHAAHLMNLQETLRQYNSARALLLEADVAREARDRALHLVEVRWEALSTAAHWLAAHHAYIVAVDDARIAITMWDERAHAASSGADAFRPGPDGEEQEAYRRILAEGYPPVEPPTDPGTEADRLRATLDQTTEYRRRLAAQTLHIAQDQA